MNHDNTLPCTYRLEVYTSAVPEFPEDGVQGVYFDRYRHDTDWYRFDMGANQLSDDKPGLWNDMRLFNMTERADAEDLPDFDLYLFGRVPGYRSLDLLDSSFRSDHATFLDPVRDPNRNTEEVHAAAFYNGTYYLEVNAYNNTGYYDVRMETPDMILSDDDNLPVRATGISSGVYESYIHQAFDHYDWYKVKALDDLRVQFDSFKGTDTFNLSIYRWDALDERFELITGDWNTRFNLTSREDQISHLIDVTIRLADFGLGAGTYYIAVFAAVASDIAVDSVSGRPYSYVTDGNAEAHYELRVWSDYVPPTPVELIRIPPVQVEEGTNLLEHVDLHDHFVSRNVGDSLRFKATVTSGKVSELVLMDDILGVVADDDYVGWVRIKVSAISEDYLTHSQNWNIEYTSVNDAPRLVDPSTAISFEMPEDSIRALDLSQIFWDVDRGDRLAITVDPSDHLTIEVDPETLVANITSAPDWFGTETVTIVATDTEGASIEVPIEIVVVNVQDAPVMLREIGTITMDEDTIFDQDLSQYLYDADGDELEVFISADTYIGHTYDAATNMMTLEPILNYHGYRVLWLTAMDSTGNRVQMQFWLEVVAVPDPPKIVLWSPVDLAVTVREGGQLTMTALQTMDPDSSVLFFRWYLDGSFVGPSISYTYKPGINDQGAHEVTVEVEDETGLKDSVTWTVTVEDVSHPPEGGIATPGQDGRFREGEPITFIAMFYDPDSEDLDYKWFINGDEVSSDPAFEKALDDGDHKITLLVSSNGDAVTQEVDISVEERSADTGWVVTGIAAMAALAIVVVAIAIARRSRS